MSGGGRARHKQARRDGRGRNIASVARSIAVAIEQLADVDDDTIARLTAQPVRGEEDGQIGRRGKESGEEGRIQPQARRTRRPQRQTVELRVRPFTRPGTWSAEVGQRPRIGPDRLSILQIELAAQPIGDGFDHLASIRVLLQRLPHDRDFPRVLMGHDRDGQISRPFADIFHLQPDGGLEFFPSFCRLFQASATVWPAERDRPNRELCLG